MMKRRSFLKKTATAGLITWITPAQMLTILTAEKPPLNVPSFKKPGKDYAPHTWWHWMNGNISKEGITLDLEAMHAVGLGGFQMFEVGTGIPRGPISYLSDEWLAMVAHTIKECKRLGLEFAMHNCPGWSSSGGPWITPKLAMQQLTWSETTLDGGKQFKGILPEPPKRLDYYEDAAVIAFPSLQGEKTAWVSRLKALNINGLPIDSNLMSNDGHFRNATSFGQPESSNFIDLIFEEPYPLKSLTMLSSGNGKLTLQYANGKTEFETIKVLTEDNTGNINSYPNYITSNFDSLSASHYRLNFFGLLKISSLSLSGARRIEDWPAKANFPGAKTASPSAAAPKLESEAINPSNVIDLSENVLPDGTLNWNVPSGQWTILKIGHTAIGRMNKSAPSTGTGLDCDKLSKAAFDFHWEQMFVQILPLIKTLEIDKIGLLIDSYELGLQNWSATFPAEFAERKQYDLLPYLPALTGRIVGSVELSERFLRDFRHAQAEVIADNYYGRFAERCRQQGILSYTEPYEGGNFEEMKIGQAVDISMGEFWAGHTMLYNNSVLSRTMKLAASIAHSKGQSVVGAEAFTAEPASGKWQQYPFSMKSLGDFMFTKGLTRIIFHRYAHQPHPTALPGMTMGPWGIHFDRTNTWFSQSREWINYLTRCQYMLRKGVFVADIAYYIGENVPTKTMDPEKTIWSPPVGYDYDLINSDCLLNNCFMKNGKLENGYGVSYRILVLPDMDIVSISILQKLETLLSAGLILIGKRPKQSFGVKDHEKNNEFERLLANIWDNNEYKNKGQVFEHTDLKSILKQLKLNPDFEYTAKSADAAINFIHRKENKQDIYFAANRRRRREDIVCSFRIQDQCPELWDPITGENIPIYFYKVEGNSISIPLLLEPSGSIFIVFKPKTSKPSYLHLSINGQPIINPLPYPTKLRGLYPTISNNFTVTCWVKPEIDICLREDGFYGNKRTDHYAIYPAAGEKYYGKRHACSGFTIGRNGVALFERSTNFINAVLFVEIPITGWSRLTIVYQNNIPSVYLNNKLIKTGRSSEQIVHPSIDEAYQDDHASYYDGEICGLELIDHSIDLTTLQRMSLVLPSPDFTPTPSPTFKGKKIYLWKNGFYLLKDNEGKDFKFQIKKLPKAKLLKDNWTVRFPQSSAATEQIKMSELLPLQKHKNAEVRYFSGTAEYLTDFTFSVPDYAHRVRLDLGRVEVLAEVSLNGNTFPVLWAQPYSLDITSAIRQGNNELIIKVTNLWPNRLIGDEQLPEENEYAKPTSNTKLAIGGAGGIKKLPDWYTKNLDKPSGGRKTFTTWKHYHKDSPLLESGLLGPVSILIGTIVDLHE